MNRQDKRKQQREFKKLSEREQEWLKEKCGGVEIAFSILLKGCKKTAEEYGVNAVPLITMELYMKTIINNMGGNGDNIYNEFAGDMGDKSPIQPKDDNGQDGSVAE